MNTRDVQCPNCSKMTRIDESLKETFCSYCGCKIHVGSVDKLLSLDKTDTLQHLQKRMKQAWENNDIDEAYKYALMVIEQNPNSKQAWDIRYWKSSFDEKRSGKSDELLLCIENLQQIEKRTDELIPYVFDIIDKARDACDKAKTLTERQDIERHLAYAMKLRCAVDDEVIRNLILVSQNTETLACTYVLAIDDYVKRFYPDGRIEKAKALEWKKNLHRINQGLKPKYISSANNPNKVFTIIEEKQDVKALRNETSKVEFVYLKTFEESNYIKDSGGSDFSLGKMLLFLAILAIILSVLLYCC